jgi:hypothetical protein
MRHICVCTQWYGPSTIKYIKCVPVPPPPQQAAWPQAGQIYAMSAICMTWDGGGGGRVWGTARSVKYVLSTTPEINNVVRVQTVLFSIYLYFIIYFFIYPGQVFKPKTARQAQKTLKISLVAKYSKK